MALTVVLVTVAVLLIVSALSLVLHATALGRNLVYGVSLAVACVGLSPASGALIGQAPAETLTLPLGLPWIGAHFRLDALSAFFLVVVNLGGARGEPLRARLRPARVGAAARAAVLSGCSSPA